MAAVSHCFVYPRTQIPSVLGIPGDMGTGLTKTQEHQITVIPTHGDVTKTSNGERGTGNGKRETGKREQGTGNREQGTGTGNGNREREQRTGNRERGTENQERKTGEREMGKGSLGMTVQR